LSSDEQREARRVFGDSLDFARVRVTESRIMSVGNYARTPFETVYFPPGAQYSPTFMPWLIHELTHAWQTQHGVPLATKLWWALHGITGDPYAYGGVPGLRDAAARGWQFTDFNTEQQGDICRHFYVALVGDADTSAFDPFIRDLQRRPPKTVRGANSARSRPHD
jgi:hypothetical protein